MLIRIRDNWGKEYRVEDSEVRQFAEQMKGEGRHFAPVRTLVNPKTGEEWDGVQWNEKAKEGKQPWEARAIDDENAAFSGYLKEGWQYKQWEEPDAWEKVKGFFDTENFKDPTGQQNDLEYNAKNVAAGVGSAVVSGVTGLANAIQGTVLNAAAFASRALGAEDTADAIADVRKETGENIRAMRDNATDAIIEGLDAQGMKDARDLVDTGLDVVEGFSGLYGLGAAVGGATKGIVKLAGSMGKTVDAAKVGGTVLAGQMGADAYEHALEEMEAQEDASGKEISGLQKTIVAGARAAMSAATSKLFGKIAGIGIPKETAQKVVERSLGQSARVLVQEMGEFAAINDLNVLADEAGRWAADVDHLDPEKGIGARILEESLHGAGMVLGMKSQKILKGAWNAMTPMRIEGFAKYAEAMKRAELGAMDAAANGGPKVVAITPKGVGVLNDGGFIRQSEGEAVAPDGMVFTADGKVRTIGAGRCGELSDGEYGIPGTGNGERRFGGDLTENACKLVALAEEGLVETRKIPLDALPGDAKSGENGIRLRLKEDGTTELVSDIPESEQKKPVVVFEREDGTFSLVTGRKRVAAGKTAKNGEIEAVVIREKDGWTEDTARVVDVVDNLMKGSPVSDTEAMTAANALGIGYKRAEEWGLTANKNVAAAFRMRENASAELEGMVTEGSVRLESADAIAQNANKSNMPGASEEHIATIQTELAVKMGLGTPDEIAAVCRKLRETDMSPEEAMDPMARSRKIDEAIAEAERERLEEAAKKSGLTPDQEAKVQNTPVEREDGTLTTVRATEEADRQVAEQKRTPDGEPSTKLMVQGDRVTCARFPEVELVRPEAEGGIAALRGLTATEMLKPENREAVTDLLEEIGRTVGEFAISGEAEMAAAQELLSARVAKRRLEAEQMRRKTINEVLGVLAGSGLAKDVHTDQASFDARLKQGKGIKTWLTSTDEVWGFTDGNEIWLNPKTARLETPIHEYGHLGIEMCKRTNRDVYDRGIAIAKETGLFREISENDAYKHDSEASRAEEVLATIIGKRGEEALKGAPETLRAKVKEWLVDFWKAFGEAIGLREITPEQAAEMTLEQVADAIRAEMMSGKRFGEGGGKNADGRNNGELKYSVAKFRSGKDYVNVDVDQHLFDGKSEKEIQKIARKVIKDRFRGKVIGEVPKNAYVKTKTAEEFAYGGKPMEREVKEAKMRSSTELDNLLAVSEHKGHEKDNGSHPEAVGGWDYYETIFKVGDKLFTGKINIMNNKKGRVFYDVTGVKENTQGLMAQYGEPQGQFPGNVPQIVSQDGDAAQGGGIKLSIGGIFTGTAADYANRSRQGGVDDGPSLKHIGTGEGSQVYGWGLYGSKVRGVAEVYAHTDRMNKDAAMRVARQSMPPRRVLLDGKPIEFDRWGENEERTPESYAAKSIYQLDGDMVKAEQALSKEEGYIAKVALEWLRNNRDRITPPDPTPKVQEHIYEQTFFTNRAPGDESHLLKWYEPVSEENKQRILEQARKEGLDTAIIEKRWRRIIHRDTGRDLGAYDSGEDVYDAVTETLGSPKAASEFLYRAGIDGVKYPVDSYGGKTIKDGDTAGWNYVSFSDENIRVDHKWTDGELKFSVARTNGGMNFVLLDRPVDIDWNSKDAVHDYLVEQVGKGAVSLADRQRVRIGEDLPKEYTRSNYAEQLFRKKRLRKLRGKTAKHLDEIIVVSGNPEAEDGDHKNRTYYRRIVNFGVSGHETARGYSAYLVTYDHKGEECLYDIVSIKENHSLSSALKAGSHGGFKILSTNNSEWSTPLIVSQDGDAAQGGRKVVDSATDAAYLDAVKRGDMETARAMVEAAAKKAGYDADVSYRGSHEAPVNDGSNASLDKAEEMFGTSDRDKLLAMGYRRKTAPQAVDAIMKAKGNPDAMIDVWRAVRTSVKDVNLRKGDWIALSEDCAHEHGRRWLDGRYRIIHDKVRAGSIFTDGNMLEEAGFDDGQARVYKNTKNGTKLLEVTYDDNGDVIPLSQRFSQENPDIRYSAKRQELPTVDGENVAAWLLNGRLRLADDAKYQPAAIKSAGMSVKYTPAENLGVSKPVNFSMSMLVDLYQSIRKNPALPKVLTNAHRMKRRWLGRMTKGSEVELNPEMFGIVSKSDEARIKAELKAEGRFRNEDPGWNMRHTKKQNDNERHMSEMLLEDRLRSLSEDRVKGKAFGENAAATAVMAHEIGVLAMQLPKTSGENEIIASMRTLGTGIKEFFEKDARQFESVRATAKSDKLRNAEIEQTNFAKGQALRAVSWWRGYESKNGEAEAYFKQNDNELYAETLGMFLAAPEALRQQAPKAFNLIVEKMAENQTLLDAYNRLTESHDGSGPAEKVMRKIEAQWTHEAQMEIAKLEKELDKPLGSGIQRAKRRVILNLHSKEGVAVSVVGDGLRENVAAAKRAWKRGDISKADFEAVRKDAKDTLRDLKLGVLKKQRGGGRDRVYALDFLGKVMGDIERDGIDLADFRRYLKAQRVIETQGRAMDFGMSPSEAQKVLDGLREKFGDGGMTYRKIEAAAMRYRAVREKNVLDDEYIVEAFGKARIDAWKRNVHYVRTQRTVSAEEAEAHNKTLDGMKRADPLTELEMLMDLHHRKHRSTHGDTFMEPLTGSLKATEDPLQATLANDIRMMAFARRNHLMVQLADIARREKLEGWKEVHDKAGEIRLDRSERYGSVSFLRDGERKLLILPKVVAEGFKHAASDVAGMVKANRMLSAVLTQYSARFAVRNLSRNRASTEINVPWMGESRLVRGARFAGMGPAARVAEILMERALVRLPDRYSRNVAANLLWGEHTNMYWMAEATRIAELMQNPKGFRELAEKADQHAANGEYGKAKQILEDIEKAREIMKHPIFAGHWEMTRGTTERTDLDEVFRALDIRTKIEDVPLKNLKKLARGLADAANAIKRFNTFEESRIKIVSILAAERAKLRAKERGGNWKYDNGDIDYISATMAGSPRYENRGRWMNVLEAISLGPFVNVSMKGALRTFESMKIDPAAWWSKAAQRYAGRMAEVALWSGGGYAFVAQVARRLFEDDEDAQQAIDGFERFGKRMARARACTSDYRIRNYDVMPLGLYGKYSAFGINIPRGDEDRLFTPMTDLFAQYLLGTEAARKMGLQEPMEGAYEGVFQTLATTATGSGLAPDLMRGSMIWNLGRDVFYSWFNNPYNTFTQRPLYDENLWKERWNRPAEFLKATLKQAWNDVGGQVVLPATTWDEDEGEVPDDGKWVMSIAEDKEQTEMPIGGKTVFRALHYVPLASAALSGVFYMNCDGDKRIARRLATMLETEKAVRDRVAMQCVEMQLKHEDTAVDYSPILDKAIEENGWDGSDRAMIEQAITRKLNFMSRKLGKQDTPILELMSRKNMSRAERERAKRYLIGIGWKGPEEWDR